MNSSNLISDGEKLVSLTKAAGYFPGTGQNETVGRATVYRWASVGCRGVRLRTCLIGGRRMTCVTWCREFVDAVTAAGDGQLTPASTVPVTTTTRRRQKEKAAEQAAALLA